MEGAQRIPNPLPKTDTTQNHIPEVLDTYNAISRSTTVSVALFHGVRPDENPSLTTFWAILGEPTFSVAVPCWVVAESVAAELDGAELSPLCTAARQLHRAHYVIDKKKRYMIPDVLKDIQAVTFPVEDRIFDQTDKMMNQWRQNYPTAAEAARFHQALARRAYRALLRAQEKPPAIIKN